MTLTGRCGFYLRVTREGFAPVENAYLERSYASGAASVREAFFAVLGKTSIESLQHVRAARGLAESWGSAVERRLATRQG
jgi:MOSC domain-containing protein YiiM